MTATHGQPLDALVDDQLLLDFADERSVVQTRFPTTVLAMARAAYGDNVDHLVADGAAALAAPLPADPADIDHLVFLGTGWTVGLANEAALKVRESAQAWSESYPAMDYRHGPIAVAGPRSLVWSFGPVPADLDESIRDAGARPYRDGLDPAGPARAGTTVRARAGRPARPRPRPAPPAQPIRRPRRSTSLIATRLPHDDQE